MNDKQQINESEDMKTYHIPVNWSVWDKIRVKAHSVDEAVSWLKENLDNIPLGNEPEYIDGTYVIEDGEDGNASFGETIDYLKKYWNLSGGIDGTDDEADYVVDGDFKMTI